jgi:acyl carrier protein
VNGQEAKSVLRDWILARDPKLRPEAITDDAPLIKGRIVTSLQLMDLVLFVEELRGRPLAPDQLRPGTFDTLETIYQICLRETAP